MKEADRLSLKYIGEPFADLAIRGTYGYSPSLYLTSGESRYRDAPVIKREKARLVSLFNAAMKARGLRVRAFTGGALQKTRRYTKRQRSY